MLISEQGTILDRSWRQLREYDSQATQVLPWLNKAEDTLARYMAQPVKSDPTVIKQQITELKVTGNDYRKRCNAAIRTKMKYQYDSMGAYSIKMLSKARDNARNKVAPW